MSDEHPPTTLEAAEESLPPGVTQLAEAALRSPAPPAEAEAASQERALSAYQETLLTPRPLHTEAWRAGKSTGLVARLAQAIRRLRGE